MSHQAEQQIAGRVMAIDLGEKRIGIAISDPLRLLARALTVIPRLSRRADFERYQQLIDEHQIKLIVLGLPLRLDGTSSSQTEWVRDYGGELAAKIACPVVFQDEALSTERARATMVERGMSRRKRQQMRDAVAAAFILQAYLDSGQGGAVAQQNYE